MKDKELRKLTRKQLLELLLAQTERADMLEEKLKSTEAMLRDRQLTEMQAGNIADAALRLNGIFDAAQAAADQYLENIVSKSSDVDLQADAILTEAKKKADNMIAEAEIKCYEREQRSEERLKGIEEKITRLRAICSEFNTLFIDDQVERNRKNEK